MAEGFHMYRIDQNSLGDDCVPVRKYTLSGLSAGGNVAEGATARLGSDSRIGASGTQLASLDQLHMVEAVTIREPSAILDAANVIAQVMAYHCMRIMVFPNIASRERMVDAEGKDLNCNVFGWQDDDGALHQAGWAASKCPIIRACRVESEPFWVSRTGFRTAVRNPLMDCIGLSEIDSWSTRKAAIVIPVHLPFGEIAVASLSSADPAVEDLSYELASFGKLFADLSRRFVSSYVITTRDNPYLPHDALLSPREVECLRWAAFGKTDKEVGLILGASHATVRYHITRVCKKLDATNRAQAIFRAAQLGYLGSPT
jgi:DNA-binding CsgD family transcriptional regulator